MSYITELNEDETVYKNGLEKFEEIVKKRGTVKGSDYVYLHEDELERRAEYREKGWVY